MQIFKQLEGYIRKYEELGLDVRIDQEKNETICIHYEDKGVDFYDSFHPLLVSVLTNHVIATKEEEWLLDIIENIFYFTDPVEQNQILTIARSILEGDREDIPSLKSFFQRESFIYQAFAKGIDPETTFYYEPFLVFRLREYGEMLIDCVEIAIDEYFLEQEYQSLVEGLRFYLKTMPKRMEVVHLVYDKGFAFYNKHYRLISRDEKNYYLDKEVVFEGDLDIDEMVISPLVSINPEMVYIYIRNKESDHSVVHTLQTIFEERVRILPLSAFKPQKSSLQ